MANFKLLIEDNDEGYEVSQNDICKYAQQIGININKEPHLMWIAKKGLTANVPEPWLICSDEKDRVFYFNPDTSESSWYHPSDKYYAALVSEERSKSKSLNSASSDYGFDSKLSSLADAPPLSSSGKNSPLPFKAGKKDGEFSGKRFEFGHIENRRGAQLAPVRLNTLKMPPANTPRLAGGMSFMPKGSSFTKNIRLVKEEKDSRNQEITDYEHPPLDDSNESINSDEGSKYSYEETDDEKQIHVQEPYDMLEASQLSPMHSADESPDAADINSLLQLRSKVPPLDDNFKKENSPSLSLRKVGQPTFLKPLTHTTKKKNGNKSTKGTRKVQDKNLTEIDTSLEDKTSAINHEQQMVLDQIKKEWLEMQDDLEKKEKEKYEEMIIESTKRLEEEELKLRNENAEKIKKIKSELQKKIEEEEYSAEISLQSLKESNKQKISEEENRMQRELERLSESLKTEIKKIEEKNAIELVQKKNELDEELSKELTNLKDQFESNKKDIVETHEAEISNLQQAHELRIKELKSSQEKKEHDVILSVSQKYELQDETRKLQELIKGETQKYQDLLTEKENILKEISCEKISLEELKNETSKAQYTIEELHDEIDKIENELDLLRSEKSGLISEINILKENISNQKTNLLNLEKKLQVSLNGANCSKEFSEIGINTDLLYSDFISKAVQVCALSCDNSSQIENILNPMLDAICQTSAIHSTANKSCQTDLVSSTYFKDVEKLSSERMNFDDGLVLDKNLENALSGLSMKLDSRINSIENQLRLLQENILKPVTHQSKEPSQQFSQEQYSSSKTGFNTENRILLPTYGINGTISCGAGSNSVPSTSQRTCKCELGNPESCSVLQDVKDSVYRLNDILCASFMPPLRTNSVYQASQPVSNYSSPFDNFYTQLRQLQERQRLVDLKHNSENSASVIQATKDFPSNLKDAKSFRRFNDSKSSYHLTDSRIYTHNVNEDPMIRAQNIVLREKARAWKEQQALQSSISHMFSMKSPSKGLQSSTASFTSPYNVPSSEQTFLNFEVDPETDFNMWMSRLNALQLRIRSHKIL